MTLPTTQEAPHKQMAIWLFVCCALVFCMVVLGGTTRLTRSGLSIVEWQPVSGIVPPLTTQDWHVLFEKYKAYPEYKKNNQGMSLSDFKKIFWFEYAHRVLGRLIGIAFLVPFLYFLVRGCVARRLGIKLFALFVLGGLQGALGWYMVKSGLIDIPRVSPYRLTAHLLLALAIYGYMLWLALSLWRHKALDTSSSGTHTMRFALTLLILIAITITSGGFVAGTHAGFAFNTFPLMHGRWIPEGIFVFTPFWRNFFENIPLVQFNHRMLAFLSALLVLSFWLYAHKKLASNLRLACHGLLFVACLQILLGISTLLLVVPVSLAASHQAGALLLFSLLIYINHALRSTKTGNN